MKIRKSLVALLAIALGLVFAWDAPDANAKSRKSLRAGKRIGKKSKKRGKKRGKKAFRLPKGKAGPILKGDLISKRTRSKPPTAPLEYKSVADYRREAETKHFKRRYPRRLKTLTKEGSKEMHWTQYGKYQWPKRAKKAGPKKGKGIGNPNRANRIDDRLR